MIIKTILSIAYYACSATEKENRKKNLLHKLYYNGLKYSCMFVLTLYLKLLYAIRKNPIQPLTGKDFIVSITTFPDRINGLWIVLDSIFRQQLRPSKIVLVLTKEEFPQGMNAIPKSLKRLLNKGLDIVFTDYNLRPHNKYYYALSTFRHQDVVTLDDDLYYWPDTIFRLYEIRKKHSDCICANKVLRIVHKATNLVGYAHIKESSLNKESHSLMAQGVGGVLYPPTFRPHELFNQELIKKYSIMNDDNWLKVHEAMNNICVATGSFFPHPLVLLQSQRQALFHQNTANNRSARITQSLLEYYHIENLIINK